MNAEDGKKIYDSIEIPDELSDVVNRAIASKNKEEIRMKHENGKKKNNPAHIWRYAAAAAAMLLICLTIGLNTSEAFAKEMSGVPVLGALARVLTVRSYHGTEGDYEIDMDVPEILTDDADAQGHGNAEETFTEDINAEIQKIVDEYMEQAKAEFQEYKDAFFAAGGTQEEWADRTMDINVEYEVKYQNEDKLSLELVTAKGWVASQEERYYYNLDLSTETYLTLRDLLGEDYVKLCNDSIAEQIKQRMAEDENQIFFGFGANSEEDAEMGISGFTTVTDATKFYINERGNVVVVFDQYEIAPGYMGFPEFEIVK